MTHNIDNTEHNNELPSQHTFEIKEEPKKAITLPSKLEIQKAFKPVKSNIAFNQKQFDKLKVAIGIFNLNLQSANDETKEIIVRCIEDQIKLNHEPFLKAFRTFKSKEEGISQSFLTNFFRSCETSLEEESKLLKDGNKEEKNEVVSRTISYLKSYDFTETDLIIIHELFSSSKVSNAKRNAQLDKLKGKK
ncbi:conserved hypothetical protein [Vibrio crassostreae]|nr:conserved hypothetical protein [Vibrio crassostreae]